jgi:hypothetical protein
MTKLKHVIIAVILIGLSFMSCKKNSSSPDAPVAAKASFTIDGGGFDKQTVTITGGKAGTSYLFYWTNYDITTLSIDDNPNINSDFKNAVDIILKGKSTGTQHAGDDAGGSYPSIDFNLHVTDKQGVLHDFLFGDPANTPGIITITKYGAVGQPVEGTFSGTLLDDDGAPTIKITNGTFSIKRGMDMQ